MSNRSSGSARLADWALTYRQTGAQLSAAITYNGLWLFIFALLMVRLHLMGHCRGAAAPVSA